MLMLLYEQITCMEAWKFEKVDEEEFLWVAAHARLTTML